MNYNYALLLLLLAIRYYTMLQRIKKCSERDSNWIIEIGLKRSIRDDKRCTKNMFISLVESEWYFTYQPVSILLSANRFTECWKTFRYFLGKDHGKVSIRERGTETSFRRYLFSRIFANSAIPLSVPTVCRVHFLQLPRLSRFFSASTFLTARPLVSVRRRSRNYLRDTPLKDRRHLSHW